MSRRVVFWLLFKCPLHILPRMLAWPQLQLDRMRLDFMFGERHP